jgi:hypothetical protein
MRGGSWGHGHRCVTRHKLIRIDALKPDSAKEYIRTRFPVATRGGIEPARYFQRLTLRRFAAVRRRLVAVLMEPIGRSAKLRLRLGLALHRTQVRWRPNMIVSAEHTVIAGG